MVEMTETELQEYLSKMDEVVLTLVAEIIRLREVALRPGQA